MELIYQKKTFLPERGVWVSTVSWDMDIGYGRCAETMVFEGDEEDITDYSDLDSESLGYRTETILLDEAHEYMVQKWRNKQ